MFVTYEGEIKYSFTFKNTWWLIWEKIQNSTQKTWEGDDHPRNR